MNSIEDDLAGDTQLLQKDGSDLSKVVDTLLNNKWRRRKTRLSTRVITKISVLDTMAQIWDIKFLKHFINNYTEYMTSEGGKGRQEIVDITKFTLDKQQNQQKDMIDALGRR